MEDIPTNLLITQSMSTVLKSSGQASDQFNPDVEGQTSFTFSTGSSVDFAASIPAGSYRLSGGCPLVRDYDALDVAAAGVATHNFVDPVTGNIGDAAVVMTADQTTSRNTIMMAHSWFDIAAGADTANAPALDFADRVLDAVIPINCQATPDPTDIGVEADHDGLPRVTRLHGNSPNPFNPTTVIVFDLAVEAHTELRIFDVGGRLVRTLVEGPLPRKHHRVVWDGLDSGGRRVSSGIYFAKLQAGDFTDVHKMVLLR